MDNWGQTAQNLSGLSRKRDYSSKRVKVRRGSHKNEVASYELILTPLGASKGKIGDKNGDRSFRPLLVWGMIHVGVRVAMVTAKG